MAVPGAASTPATWRNVDAATRCRRRLARSLPSPQPMSTKEAGAQSATSCAIRSLRSAACPEPLSPPVSTLGTSMGGAVECTVKRRSTEHGWPKRRPESAMRCSPSSGRVTRSASSSSGAMTCPPRSTSSCSTSSRSSPSAPPGIWLAFQPRRRKE
eukprot:scaffold116596_cov30-Tisochrysis_lutea.AAC.2